MRRNAIPPGLALFHCEPENDMQFDLATSLCAFTLAIPAICFGQPVMHVVEIDSKRVIQHEVKLQTVLASEPQAVTLVGPVRFSTTELSEGNKTTRAALSWYEISELAEQESRTVTIWRDKSEQIQIDLGRPVYLLTPAMILTSGAPEDHPVSLNNFVAFRVAAQHISISKLVEKPAGLANVEEALYLCLPAEEWHHEEHFPIKMPSRGFIIVSGPQSTGPNKLTMLDQFGLNEVMAKSRLKQVGIEIEYGVNQTQQ